MLSSRASWGDEDSCCGYTGAMDVLGLAKSFLTSIKVSLSLVISNAGIFAGALRTQASAGWFSVFYGCVVAPLRVTTLTVVAGLGSNEIIWMFCVGVLCCA